ncbi:hypothetical protein BD311DRAFT_748513 [Dichomitus squalens]|uniref:Uncharacterized protein n=1 Tax=Dichomitus squalens TaxID=114155 RepID=A0A4Q9MZ27_9APHY|nr:hypothetical protein BD311DRAFT_748513 [Dichomitus squalens]
MPSTITLCRCIHYLCSLSLSCVAPHSLLRRGHEKPHRRVRDRRGAVAQSPAPKVICEYPHQRHHITSCLILKPDCPGSP